MGGNDEASHAVQSSQLFKDSLFIKTHFKSVMVTQCAQCAWVSNWHNMSLVYMTRCTILGMYIYIYSMHVVVNLISVQPCRFGINLELTCTEVWTFVEGRQLKQKLLIKPAYLFMFYSTM